MTCVLSILDYLYVTGERHLGGASYLLLAYYIHLEFYLCDTLCIHAYYYLCDSDIYMIVIYDMCALYFELFICHITCELLICLCFRVLLRCE